MAFRVKSKAEKALDQIKETLSKEEYAELAMLCLDQAGCSKTFQRRIERIINSEVWMSKTLD